MSVVTTIRITCDGPGIGPDPDCRNALNARSETAAADMLRRRHWWTRDNIHRCLRCQGRRTDQMTGRTSAEAAR